MNIPIHTCTDRCFHYNKLHIVDGYLHWSANWPLTKETPHSSGGCMKHASFYFSMLYFWDCWRTMTYSKVTVTSAFKIVIVQCSITSAFLCSALLHQLSRYNSYSAVCIFHGMESMPSQYPLELQQNSQPFPHCLVYSKQSCAASYLHTHPGSYLHMTMHFSSVTVRV